MNISRQLMAILVGAAGAAVTIAAIVLLVAVGSVVQVVFSPPLPTVVAGDAAALPSSTATLAPTRTPLPTATATSTPVPTPAVLIGAGDISVCGFDTDDWTAALIELLLGQYPHAQVFTTGDNAQVMGEPYEYNECFHPAWGRFKDRIHPSPGNHDWFTERGTPYFEYFGPAAGPPGRGYYSYDLGEWHIVSLNSNCETEDNCSMESEQARWLREDLQRNQRRCTLLYWHHPLRSSGLVPILPYGQAFWEIASDYGADIVINGHDHHYERFVPLGRTGNVDYENGMRSFIAGTGGAWLFEQGVALPITETRQNTSYGVMLFTLYPERYEWQFIPADGSGYMDLGQGQCR